MSSLPVLQYFYVNVFPVIPLPMATWLHTNVVIHHDYVLCLYVTQSAKPLDATHLDEKCHAGIFNI